MDTTTTRSNDALRPPIVTILGHVDHGKTTLLDRLRKTKIAEREAGGITQSIGASVVTTPSGQKLTFIDTPGHAVFNEMRSRGAQVADISLLIVAADDGVKPQTKEALAYIREAKIPFLVVLTKIDLPGAVVENAKNSLRQEGITFEGEGGDIPCMKVSARSGEGIDDLLEMIALVAQINEVGKDDSKELNAIVLETVKNKGGSLVSVVLKSGEINVGDVVYAHDNEAKVRGIFDEFGKQVKKVQAGYPASILGFSELPSVGTGLTSHVQNTGIKEVLHNMIPTVSEDEIPLVVKANTTGSLEAIINHIQEKVIILQSSVGNVSESDVFFAKSAGAQIVTFESRVPNPVANLAKTEGVEIKSFDVIYKLFEYLDELLDKKVTKIKGKATVLALFPFNKQKVAGCKVNEGEISKKDRIHIIRNEKLLGETKVSSLKKEKKEVDVIKAGEECGIMFSPYIDFEVGDVITSIS